MNLLFFTHTAAILFRKFSETLKSTTNTRLPLTWAVVGILKPVITEGLVFFACAVQCDCEINFFDCWKYNNVAYMFAK
jgi:hypothetical protein